MLDTDICIEMIRGKKDKILKRLSTCEIGSVGISAITFSELAYGIEKSVNPEKNRLALSAILSYLIIYPYSSQAGLRYGFVRAFLERSGKSIGPLDNLIAAHALAEDAILVTNNEREFRRVEGLRVENWIR